MKIKSVDELFDNKFFEKLKDFILKESFDEFYNRKLEENRNYSQGYTKFWLNTEYLGDLDIDIIYPLTYDWFIDSYIKDGSCAYIIDKYLFHIKYLIKEVFENKNSKYLNNKFCSIQFNKNIIEKVYDAEIYKKLYNSKLKNLVIINLYENTTDFNAHKNLTVIYARNLLLYVFEYLKSYLENLLKKVAFDTLSNIDSYRYETSMNILNNIPNQSKEMRKLTNKLKTLAKQHKTARFNEDSGTKPKEITGDFPQTKDGLQNCIKKYENMLNEYPEIVSVLRDLKRYMRNPEDKKIKHKINIFKIKKEIYEILNTKENETLYITSKDTFIETFVNDDISILYPILSNYIDLIIENYVVTFSQAVMFTMLEQSGNIKLFTECELKPEAIKKFFARKTNNEKFITEEKIFKIYTEKEFTEKYNKLFNP